jgi:alkaline phosphatase
MFLVSSLLLTLSCSQNGKQPVPKYVFLFIGDGMGIQQVNAAQAYKATLDSLQGNAHLSFTNFPATGFMTTYAENRYITCSAAAGTAIASGSKTSIGTIGLNANHSDSLFSIAYRAHRSGFHVGIVSSVSIDHATPAAFYAHQTERDLYHEIAHDLLKSNFRFFGSGGFRDPLGKKSKNSQGSIFQRADSAGFLFTSNLSLTPQELSQYSSIVYSAPDSLASGSNLKYKLDAKPSDISLAQITKMGIDVLFNPKGFFMMIEGGKIDWACHDNDAATTIHDILSFSDAIQVAIDFYNRYPNETLIVVTADHETGGMSMGVKDNFYESNISLLSNQRTSYEQFNRLIKDLQQKTDSKITFNEVLSLIKTNFGLGGKGLELSENELSLLHGAYERTFVNNVKPIKVGEDYNNSQTLTGVAVEILNRKAGIGWTTFSHTGSQVPVYALGAGQELFVGQIDNTYIAPTITKLMGIPMGIK